MRKYICAFLMLMLVLTTLLAGVGAPALASPNVQFSVTPVEAERLNGGDVRFNFTIENKDAVTYSDCVIKCGDFKKEISNLAPNSVESNEFTMPMSDSMLGQSLEFVLLSEGNTLATAKAKVNKKAPDIKVNLSVKADKEIAASGETVKFTFTIENMSNIQVSDIVVKAPGLNGGKQLKDKFSLQPKGNFTFSYTHKMGSSDLTVKPEVTFTANNATHKEGKEPITVTLAKLEVKVELSVDKPNPQPGEEVTFTLNVINNGNMSYSRMKVSMNGEEVSFPTSRLKPGETHSQTYKRSFATSSEVSFSITMENQNGEQKSVKSNTVRIELPVDSAVINQKVRLSLDVDRPQLTSAGTVNFSGFVTNPTEFELLNVQVNEATLGNIYSVSALEAGGQDSIQVTADIDVTTTYHFVLTATDKDGNSYTINADPITVTVQSVEPTPTNFEDAPDVTESHVLDGGKKPFDAAKFFLILAIVLVVLIIGVGVALIVIWKKGKGGRPTGGRPAGKTASRGYSSKGRGKGAGSSYGRGGSRKKGGGSAYRDRNSF